MSAFLQWFVIISWALVSPVWAGGAELLDATQLTEVLKSGQPCCVIDARNESRRKQQPIPFALAYQEGMRLSGSGFAVVVADYDQKALQVAQTLARQGDRNVYAVKGGYAAWKLMPAGGANSSGRPDAVAPNSFTIPSNTCEQGKSLQEFK